ncbi:lysozyme C-like [Amia ocellicauda]|uniref:lysozyme C-like n=1 Tax=Amia ocellicauda TaxID=2972642 RepID=UPI003463ED07
MNSLPVIASALLVLLTMAPYTPEAKVFEKCELASILLPIARDLNNTNPEELISKVICHIEGSTGMNSSAVTPVKCTPPPPPPPPTKKPRLPRSKVFSDDSSSSSEERGCSESTLLGLFQLPSKFVCQDGKNWCQLNCSKLTDDDISDDIACVKTVLKLKAVRRDDDFRYDFKCSSTNVTSYLSDCQL